MSFANTVQARRDSFGSAQLAGTGFSNNEASQRFAETLSVHAGRIAHEKAVNVSFAQPEHGKTR